ncbi:hypothetical protein OG203_15040 [Nocardia sp. NBC_01499]
MADETPDEIQDEAETEEAPVTPPPPHPKVGAAIPDSVVFVQPPPVT